MSGLKPQALTQFFAKLNKTKMKKQKTPVTSHYRQGDVLIERIGSLPKNLRPIDRENGKVVLAHGEVTGHAHAIADAHVTHFAGAEERTADGLAGVTFLEVRDAMAALVHEEHSTIPLDPGVYRITRQREYSPEALRNVAD